MMNRNEVVPLDARELRWAAEEVAALIRQTDQGSVVGTILQQTLRELTSLKKSAEGAFYYQPPRMAA